MYTYLPTLGHYTNYLQNDFPTYQNKHLFRVFSSSLVWCLPSLVADGLVMVPVRFSSVLYVLLALFAVMGIGAAMWYGGRLYAVKSFVPLQEGDEIQTEEGKHVVRFVPTYDPNAEKTANAAGTDEDGNLLNKGGDAELTDVTLNPGSL